MNRKYQWANKHDDRNSFAALTWWAGYKGSIETIDGLYVTELKRLGVSDERIEELKMQHKKKAWERAIELLEKKIADNPDWKRLTIYKGCTP